MRIVQINGGVFGSTGRIMFGITDVLKDNGHETLCFSPVTTTNRKSEPDHPYEKIGSFRLRQLNILAARLTGFEGCFAYFSTKRMLRRIGEFKPDIIHIHTIHGSFINIPLLFGFIKKNKIKTVWTLHDCWAFTGHCPHFIAQGCGKWKTGCFDCPNYREYPQSVFDNSKRMYRLKKKWFSGIADFTIVTPSDWLAGLVKQSFLNRYPVRVINNGIDLSIFKPENSDFRLRYGLKDKYIVLGVAFGWGTKKGLDVFIRLAEELPEGFAVVLVGTDENVEKQLPSGIISIRRTRDAHELAAIYTAADVFVNPTREDNFPTVNIEALACGTPVITFDTGGSAEMLSPSCGLAVKREDAQGLKEEILRVCREKPYSSSACRERALEFDENIRLRDYLKVYGELSDERAANG